jgi:hypothetical protein
MGNPTVTPYTEVWHNGGFLVSEANGHLSREQITLKSGTKYLAGMVLGKVETGTSAAAAALGTNTGDGTVGTISLVSTPSQVGNYDVTFTAATAFTVTAPNGQTATGSTGTAFAALGIGFTITAGATAMVAGNGFTIAVSGKVGLPTATATAKATNTGNATCGTVSCNGYAPKVGVYTVNFSAATKFVLEDPDGDVIGHGTTGTALNAGGLSFTITAGSTAFIASDAFAITVAAGTGKYAQWNPAAADGSQTAAGILFLAKDATSAEKASLAIVRQAEVNASELVWLSTLASGKVDEGIAQLANLGIIAR